MSQPLAARLRPQNLDEFIGQKHLVGDDKPLRKVLELGVISSMIFWGPPGVGKTTLARILARHAGREFVELSAVSAGKADVREVVERSRGQRKIGESYAAPVLFLDEIHRFNKAQQDFLLPYVEDGTIILIGATTENPSFEVIPALLSRCRVFVLESLTDDDIQQIMERGARELNVSVDEAAMAFLVNYAGGDARQSLNLMQAAVELYQAEGGTLTVEHLQNTAQSKQLRYDKQAEEHYNTISAYIKSMRASNPDA